MKMRFVSMWSSRFSGPRALRSTRRTATVTMSAPEASCASRMTCRLGYLPVPTMSRDLNSRPARINESVMARSYQLSAADERHDLERVPVVEAHGRVLRARHHAAVVLDRDRAPLEGEPAQELGERGARGQGHGLPVHRNLDA